MCSDGKRGSVCLSPLDFRSRTSRGCKQIPTQGHWLPLGQLYWVQMPPVPPQHLPPPRHNCQEEETTVHHCLIGPGGRGPWIEQLHALRVDPQGSRCQSDQRRLNLTRGERQYYVWAHRVVLGVWTPTASWGLSLCALWGPGRATPTAGLRKPESEGRWRPQASCPTTPFLKRVQRGLQRLLQSPRPSGLPIYTGTSDGNV